MFKTLSLSAAAVLASIAVTPVAAEARHYDGYSSGGHYQQVRNYRGDRRAYRNQRSQRHYNSGSYCRDKGNGGTVIGAIAGGLLGHEVAGRGNDRTMGTIIGAGVGAVAGRAIDRNC